MKQVADKDKLESFLGMMISKSVKMESSYHDVQAIWCMNRNREKVDQICKTVLDGKYYLTCESLVME